MNYCFLQLKSKLKNNIEDINKRKLDLYNENSKMKFISYAELEEYFKSLSNKFTLTKNNKEDIEKKFKTKIIDQCEISKNNDITFGILNEKNYKVYHVTLIIFEKEIIYSNILHRSFNCLKESKIYFSDLKYLIMNNDLEQISKYILTKI
ncbi:MAG: hypothetical protein WCR80_06635 [Bacilli bacterium]